MSGLAVRRGLGLILVLAGFLAAGCGHSVTWTPDGRALTVDVAGKLQLFSLTTRTFQPLDTGGRYGFSPAFSPDGRKLAYYGITGSGSQAVCDIWLRELPGSPATDRKVASDVVPAKGLPEDTANGKGLLQLAWSPDGRKLAHARLEQERGRIEVIDLASGTALPLEQSDQSQFLPAWSPDGSHLAYLARVSASKDKPGRLAGFAVYVAEAGSSESARKLWTGPQAEFWPAWPLTWSPDGTEIAALQNRGDGTASLYLLPTDGSAGRPLTGVESVQGSVTPDLTRVVFMGGQEHSEVVFKAAPFQDRRVLDRIEPRRSQAGPWGKPDAPLHPVLSNDGTLVALPIVDGKRELRLYELSSGAIRTYPIP